LLPSTGAILEAEDIAGLDAMLRRAGQARGCASLGAREAYGSVCLYV
jgi:hypothetical protein